MSFTQVSLGTVMKHRKGSVQIDDDTEYKLCRVQLHRKGVVLRSNTKGHDIKTKKQQLCKTNDFIVAEMDAKLGGYGFIPKELDNAIVSSHYFLFEVDTNLLLKEYFEVILQTDILQTQIKAKGSTNYSAVRPSDILAWKIPLPDLERQKEIAIKISSNRKINDKLKKEYSIQLQLLNNLRQQILQDAIQGKLVPQNAEDEPASVLLEKIKAEKEELIKEKKIKKDKPLPTIKPEEIPFEIPEGWVWCRLGEIAYIASGSTPSQEAFVETGGVPYLKMYNLKNQKIDFYYKPQYIKEDIHNGQLKRSKAVPGDLLMNIVGPPLGKLAIVPYSLPQCNFNQAAVLIRGYSKGINEWFYWYLNEMSEINSIVTKGMAGQDNISVTQANNIKVPLPSFEEQKRIICKIDKLLRLCNLLEESIKCNNKKLEEVMNAAIKNVFNSSKIGLIPA